MTWYLAFRALCVFSFVASVGALVGAGIASYCHKRVWPYVVVAAVFAITGCLLVGVGWSGVQS